MSGKAERPAVVVRPATLHVFPCGKALVADLIGRPEDSLFVGISREDRISDVREKRFEGNRARRVWIRAASLRPVAHFRSEGSGTDVST